MSCKAHIYLPLCMHNRNCHHDSPETSLPRPQFTGKPAHFLHSRPFRLRFCYCRAGYMGVATMIVVNTIALLTRRWSCSETKPLQRVRHEREPSASESVRSASGTILVIPCILLRYQQVCQRFVRINRDSFVPPFLPTGENVNIASKNPPTALPLGV